MKIFLMMLAPLLCWAQQANTTPDPKRHALVVGNGDYSTLPVFQTAMQDAQVMKKALEAAKFDVMLVQNTHKNDLFEIYAANFLKQLQPGDVVFFYYSGHAVQGDDNDDYLLPIDFSPGSELKNSFRMTRFLQDLVERKVSVKFLMLEGSHPLLPPVDGAGLGTIVPDLRDSGETLFAMSAEPGKLVTAPVAPQTSLFTQAVVEKLGVPGLPPAQIFDQATQKVQRDTAQRQIPSYSSTIGDNFYFTPPVEITVIPTPPPDPVVIRVEPARTNTRDRQEYVIIPAGKFKMGCVPDDKKCKPNEKPQHEVTISAGFWMGRNEVKVRAYRDYFIKDSKGKFKMPRAPNYNRGWSSGDFPMVLVTWDEANAFCVYAGGRLPTEAEWEYASRAGVDNEVYPLNSENSRDKANFDGTRGNDKYDQAAPVDSFDANAFNLYDMAGNVWEWVADRYAPAFDSESPVVDPTGPKTGKDHVMRGGSFESKWEDDLRISVRKPGGSAYNVGFRCVLEDNDQTRKRLNLR